MTPRRPSAPMQPLWGWTQRYLPGWMRRRPSAWTQRYLSGWMRRRPSAWTQRWLSGCRSGFSPTILLSLLLLGLPLPAHAHEVRPAYFEIVEHSDALYSLTWKQPSLTEARIAIDPGLPATCAQLDERNVEVADGGFIARWQVRCRGG